MRLWQDEPMTPDEIYRAQSMRKLGWSWRSISQVLKRPDTTIRTRLDARYRGARQGRPSHAWPEDKERRLRQLWAEGWSASQIAERIGGVSRNAVIGKLHRMGLVEAKRPGAKRAPPRATKPKSVTWQPKKPKAEDVPYREPPPDVPAEKRVKHNDLEAHHCRWPCGDPKETDFGFCGEQKIPGQAYCRGHLEKATETVEMRRARSRRKALEEA
jgi:GcrA cell cycle regulator